MPVNFYDFSALHDDKLISEIKEKFDQIFKENSFIEGSFNDEFEKKFALLQGNKNCLLVANGTDALEISLQAIDIQPGDKVGVPGITFYATAEAVINKGATPVFIDVNPESGLLCPDSLKRICEKHQLKAVIPVHIYGHPAPIKEIEEICDPLGIKIIEDGAQSQGGNYLHGGPIGSSKNLITYSFYPTKNLGAFGDAGAILTQDSKLAEKIKSIRNHGRSPNGYCLIGRNSRCDSFQAAVLLSKLKYINGQNQQRKKIAQWYFENLQDLNLKLPPKEMIENSAWHLFPIILDNRDHIKTELAKKEIGTGLYPGKAVGDEEPLKNYPGERENSEKFAANNLCLPINPFISEEQVKQLATCLRELIN